MKPFSREDRLVRDIASRIQADCVFIAVRRTDDPLRLVGIAVAGDGAPTASIEVDWSPSDATPLQGFERVRLAGDRPVADGVIIPVRDGFGQALGALGMLHSEPRADREAVKKVLERFSSRAAAELDRSIIDGELQDLVAPQSTRRFEDRLGQILKSLARVSRAPIAFVTELQDDSARHGRALLVLNRGEFSGPYEYDLAGAPCEDVHAHGICFHTQGVRELYPDFEFLQQANAEGYLGLPIHDARGRTLGHVGIISDRPFPEELFDLARMRIFASLIGSEVSRSRADADRIKSERETLEAQRLESLGLLAGGVAHDFNNLLAAITTSVELALTEPNLPPALLPHLDAIKRSSTSAADLANELLAYAGHGERVVEPLDLSKVIEGLEHLFTTAARNTTLIRLRLRPDLPSVQANRTQIAQLAMNLVFNGIEAVGEEGSGLVDVSTSFVTLKAPGERPAVGTAKPGDYVALEVSDTGSGIDPAIARRIFDPFLSTKRRGRGLGLAIVQGIVQGHDASLFLESNLGKGTKIRVLFPVTAQFDAGSSSTAAPAPEGDTQAHTILVVEDQEIVMETTRSLCEHLGHRVIGAADGTTALRLFAEHENEIDLVLLDVNLPDLDGRAVLRELRARSKSVPVLLTSGYVQDAARQESERDPLVGFLKKPFRARNVAEAIARLDGAVRRS